MGGLGHSAVLRTLPLSGSLNRRISGYGLSPFAQIGSLRSPTSDMRQPLSEIANQDV